MRTNGAISVSMKNSVSEPKTTCKRCGAEILLMTAERTGGYCMPHRYLGLRFVDRIGSKMELGDEVSFDTARDEFERSFSKRTDERDGDSKERFRVFATEVQEGGAIRRFSGQPRDIDQPIYPCRGFALVREGTVVGGVVTKTAINHASIRDEAEALMVIAGCEDDLAAAEREVLEQTLEERLPDYWGGPF